MSAQVKNYMCIVLQNEAEATVLPRVYDINYSLHF